jgi:hypothetical protein
MQVNAGMVVLVAVGSLAACSSVKPPLADTDAASTGDTGSYLDANAADARADAFVSTDAGGDAKPDTGAPPADSVCDQRADAWSSTAKVAAPCTERRVFKLESWATTPVYGLGLSIARTPSGRVVIAANGATSYESGELHVRTFAPKTPNFTSKPTIIAPTPQASDRENVGSSIRLAAGRDDVVHLVYQRDESRRGGDVMYRQLSTADTLSSELPIATGGLGTELGLAVSPINGDVLATYYVPAATAGETGRLQSRLRAMNTGMFMPPDSVQSGFAPIGVFGNGQTAVRFTDSGAPRIAFQFAQNKTSGVPLYLEFSTGLWGTGQKTIDNNRLDGTAGYSVGLALYGQKKHVAYYYRARGATTAELRIGSWTLDTEVPTVEVRQRSLLNDSPDDAKFSLALDVDRFGLLHLAYVSPSVGDRCSIGYMRQTVVGGEIKWFDDTLVSDTPCTDSNSIHVAMVVDPSARPHIAYDIASIGLFYATRFDR